MEPTGSPEHSWDSLLHSLTGSFFWWWNVHFSMGKKSWGTGFRVGPALGSGGVGSGMETGSGYRFWETWIWTVGDS